MTPGGKLRLRFRAHLPGKGLHRFGETTELEDTPENRRRLEALAALISAEIRIGAFDYLKRFPSGSKADAFRAARAGQRAVPAGAGPTVDGYYQDWIGWKRAERVRTSRLRDYGQHFRAYVLPTLGSVRIDEIGLPHVRDLQLRLRQKDLSQKTIRNVILGSLKAMLRDARRDGYAVGWPFRDLDWEETIEDEPDPFTEEERDRLLEHFLTRRWKVG
ncbi:MAG: Arm DNA-binding domain-containing protein, partial [Candidatus Binatia bacterium]